MSGKAENIERCFWIGSVRFSPDTGELTSSEHMRALEPKPAAVLEQLCARRGEVVRRDRLLDTCWLEGQGSDEALTQVVSQIRRRLQEMGVKGAVIETLPKRGYRLSSATAGEATRMAESPATGLPTTHGGANRWWLLGLGATLILLTLWLATSHGPRHILRHALGLADMSQAPPTGH